MVLTGCSGGGKSTLLAALARRGYATIAEPGRRVVAVEAARDGRALPWIDLAAFARRAIDLALADREDAKERPGPVFFDRSLVDAASALENAGGEPVLDRLGRAHRYGETVFFAPPWREIFRSDPERRHRFEDACAEADRLGEAYPRLGYRLVPLPKIGVEARADFVLAELGIPPGPVEPARLDPRP